MQTQLEQELEKEIPLLQPRFYIHERKPVKLPSVDAGIKETGIRDRGFLDFIRWAFAAANPEVTEDDLDAARNWLQGLYRRMTPVKNGYFLEYEVESSDENPKIHSREEISQLLMKNEYNEKIRICHNLGFMFHQGIVSEDPRKEEQTVVGISLDPSGKLVEAWTVPDIDNLERAIVYNNQEQRINGFLGLKEGSTVSYSGIASGFADLFSRISK